MPANACRCKACDEGKPHTITASDLCMLALVEKRYPSSPQRRILRSYDQRQSGEFAKRSATVREIGTNKRQPWEPRPARRAA